MRRLAISLSLIMTSCLAGCSFDLFHDTSWLTACEIDPTVVGCADAAAQDGGPDAPADVVVEGDVGVGEEPGSDDASDAETGG
jgi:hypothetical protein